MLVFGREKGSVCVFHQTTLRSPATFCPAFFTPICKLLSTVLALPQKKKSCVGHNCPDTHGEQIVRWNMRHDHKEQSKLKSQHSQTCKPTGMNARRETPEKGNHKASRCDTTLRDPTTSVGCTLIQGSTIRSVPVLSSFDMRYTPCACSNNVFLISSGQLWMMMMTSH